VPILPDPLEEQFSDLRSKGVSQTEAAIRIGVNPACAANTGSRMAKKPHIAARITELSNQTALTSSPNGTATTIREKDHRLNAIDSRWHRLNYIIDTRALNPDYQAEPGGNTGLLIKTVRVTRSKESTSEEVSFKLDVDLLREIRELEESAAVELGQRVKHSEQRTSTTKVSLESKDLHAFLKATYGDLSPSDRAAFISAMPDVIEAVSAIGDNDADTRQSGDDSADAGDGDSSS
jgi:hypothetical protein